MFQDQNVSRRVGNTLARVVVLRWIGYDYFGNLFRFMKSQKQCRSHNEFNVLGRIVRVSRKHVSLLSDVITEF